MMGVLNDQRSFIKPPSQPVQLTEEDTRKIQECYKDIGFVQNILPGALWGFGVGFLGTSLTRFRSKAPIVGAVSGIVTFMFTKVHYMSKCLEKVAQDPSSSLHHLIQARKAIREHQVQDHKNVQLPSQTAPTQIYNNSLNTSVGDDQTYISVSTFDQSPSVSDENYQEADKDVEQVKEIETQLPQPTLSYNDLRRKNREDYMKKYERYEDLATQLPKQQPKQTPDPDTIPQGSSKTKYGDVWD